jgi:hypothetical protein
MDADDPGKKAPIQEPPPEDEANKGKVKQADKQSDTEPFDVPKDDIDEQKSDPKRVDRKPETFASVGAARAAAYFQTFAIR